VGEDLTECTLNYYEEIPLAEGSLLQQRTESEAVNEVHEATPPETPVEVTLN